MDRAQELLDTIPKALIGEAILAAESIPPGTEIRLVVKQEKETLIRYTNRGATSTTMPGRHDVLIEVLDDYGEVDALVVHNGKDYEVRAMNYVPNTSSFDY